MSKKKATVPHFSENISEFCKLMEQAKRDYAWNYAEVNRMDKLTQDYLHMLELGDLNYKERAKIATKIQNCRKQRRQHKDMVEALGPLVAFLAEDRGNNLLNLMKEVLGKTRRVESHLERRIYVPRVLGKDDDA